MIAGCVKCGVSIRKKGCLWDVAPTFWCDSCYKADFPITTAQGIYCVERLTPFPEVSHAEHLRIQATATAIWSSAEEVSAWKYEYPGGIYYPVYTQIWELKSEERISTAHLANGRCVAIGRPWGTPEVPVAVVAPIVSTTRESPEPPTAPAGTTQSTQTEYTREVQGIQWTFNEVISEIIEGATSPVDTVAIATPPAPMDGVEVEVESVEPPSAPLSPQPPGLIFEPITPLAANQDDHEAAAALIDMSGMQVVDSWEATDGFTTPLSTPLQDEMQDKDVVVLQAPDDDEYLFPCNV